MTAPVPYTEAMSRAASNEGQIRAFYDALFRAWGPQHWWPARTRFEVIVGAYLTQNTAWTNVERAMRQLRRGRLLNLAAMRRAPVGQLEQAIRSAGYFRQKARRLKTFIEFLDARYDGSLARMFAQPTAQLRQELLALNGVGPETADTILLYAGGHPVFVVDAYTRRILERHGMTPGKAGYEDVRALVEHAFQTPPPYRCKTGSDKWGPAQQKLKTGNGKRETPLRGVSHPPSAMSRRKRTRLAQLFNEMHGLMVGVGKNHCLKAEAHCAGCPLERFLR
jgi:endonuclease-3 related protein